MNDPGLDEPISNDAKDVENQVEDERDEKIEDEQEFLAPSRWWFASTAFPLIAGTFGPMASAFSICALVVHWRVYIPLGAAEQNGIPIEDPKWLIGVNAAQLAIAIISNFFLLMNMAKRVRFAIAQPITIVGWYLSSFALIGLCACASGPLVIEPRSDHAFSQGFYYAIFSAGLYFMVATMMLVTVYGAYAGHYDKEFKLTMSQRTLMLQTISFLVYLLLGALVFSHIEGWKYLDALYWADFTLLTVGIGDYSPATHLGRGLLFPFAIGGIIILGLVIGSIRSLVLERGKVKMGARMVEKERQRLLKKLQKKNKTYLLQPLKEDKPPISRQSSRTLEQTPSSERDRRQQEFEMMRKIQERAHEKRRWTSLVISGTTWFFLWFVGAAIFERTEYGQDWSYFGSMYFAYTSLLTIGYGDFYPQSNSGKAFFVFWSLLAIPSLTILISNMGDTIVKMIRDLTLWIGNFTVLPGEQGVKATLKESAHKLTQGKLFNDEVSEQPPGLLGESKRRNSNDSDDNKNDPESAAQRAAGDRANQETVRAAKQGESNDELPESRSHYHLILIKEMGKVMKHLHSSPPRKYTFDEWAWFLKLIGEDESSAETHRKAKRKPQPDGEGLGAALGDDDKTVKWSWVGNRSPLMGNKEEAEWVLERLHITLQRELDKLRKEELESKGNSGNEEKGEKMTQKRPDVENGMEGPSIDSSRTATEEKDARSS
ncbi:voltage-gated potassium channel [Mollisia scopiformis]|uniref:Voltage-gated potassium channel n=1 Tax=Mollisia scopiformis TaxID=149040 RepID=A0A194WWD6_MOLSC|nr:voltage-gated potassium channel [Mollisia scopiformis]KUJ12293.1 voltage-gated potassium channel [Mollisia scopiformis]